MRVLVAIILLTCVGCSTDNKIPLDSDLYGYWGDIDNCILFSSHGKFLFDHVFPSNGTFLGVEYVKSGNYYVVGKSIVFQVSYNSSVSSTSESHMSVVANYSIQNDTLTLACHNPFFDGKWVKSNIKSKETIQPLH